MAGYILHRRVLLVILGVINIFLAAPCHSHYLDLKETKCKLSIASGLLDLYPEKWAEEPVLIQSTLNQNRDGLLVQKDMVLPIAQHDNHTLPYKSKTMVQLQQEYRARHGRIGINLFTNARRSGLPDKVLVSMFEAFRHDVSYQRSLKLGDSYGVLYEVLIDPSRQEQVSDFLLAHLFLSGKSYSVLHFKPRGSRWGYYSERGERITGTKELLKIPIRGARITSFFGKRHHPVFRKRKAHQGLDFAAPVGTPVTAARDGIIEKVGWKGSYGQHVCIKHSRDYMTVYAHLSRIAQGVQAGKKIRQSQVIGYVGTTGLSTGPHLHYEVVYKGQKINPSHLHIVVREQLTCHNLQDLTFYKKCLEEVLGRLGASERFE